MELFDSQYAVCPHCGYAVGTKAEEAIHIKPGSLLHDRYIIGRVLGYGGFGVTYIAWDGRLEQKVAIKEYLPSEFSTRMPGQLSVTVFNGEKGEQFQSGIEKFVDEARRLAKFQNEEGIVKIFDSFQENATAYIVMEYLNGETLKEYLEREGVINEDKAVEMLIPLMQSLKTVHDEGILHRDIAPDNIFLTTDGEVKLIDFGASRYATTSHSRSLTVIIKPGFSPEEQYRSRGDQGAHTDVYALSATLYKMITGKTPADAMERRVMYENKSRDLVQEPSKLVKNISINRENAIMNALNVRIEDRTPDIDTFIKELQSDTPVKRIYGKIKKIDFYRWPLWLKITVPAVLALFITFGVLLVTGVIDFNLFSEEIVIPDGIVIAPNIEGMPMEDAFKDIEKAGLLALTDGNVESKYISPGTVVLQTPAGGSYLETNGTVYVKISSGETVEGPENGVATVPFVIADDVETVRTKFNNAGLGEPIIEEVYDENVAEGQVISQSVDYGTEVEEGTVITIKVSLGAKPFAMPDMKGKGVLEAQEELQDLGLVVKIVYENDDSVPENTVIGQSIDKNADVKRGSEITITISSKEDLVKVANVVGKTRDEAVKALEEAGFEVKVIENHDANVPKGKVISQTPAGDSSQKKGTAITVYVSKGKQEFGVIFDANGGSVSTGSKKINVGEPYGDLPTPTRTGYTFNGWFAAKGDSIQIKKDTKVTWEYNHTVYAHWTANSYTVSFNANGGSVSGGSITVKYGSKYGDLPVPTNGDKAFAGWYTAASGGTNITSSSTYNTAGNQTLYAHWASDAVTVTLNANGGSVSSSTIAAKKGGSYGTLPTPTRTGYKFDGWFTAASGGSKVDGGTKISATTLYAHWTVITVTVTLDANGGSVSSNKLTVAYDGSYSLPTPTRSGHNFVGWYTSASGGAKVENGAKMTKTENHTLYAQWSVNTVKVTVSFNGNGGSVSSSSATVTVGSTYGTLPTASRSGYSFTGWYTAASGGTKIEAGTKVSNSSNHTLYAQWKAASVTVTYNANGGSVSPASAAVTYGGTYPTLPTPTRSGYTFNGWYTAESGGTKITSGSKVNTASNHTIYAQWTKILVESDWVLKSDVPAGAQIVKEKWKYDEKVTTYTEYGAWSEWSDTVYTKTDTRDVKTRDVTTDSGSYKQYAYRDRKVDSTKTVTKDSNTQVTAGGNISNVRHYVKYLK